MSLAKIIKKYALPVALGAGLIIGGCGPAGYYDNYDPQGTEQAATETAEVGGEAEIILQTNLVYIVENSATLTDKLETETETGLYTIIAVDHPIIMFDDSYGTLNISITRIVALEKGFTDMENYVTFLYLGDKPVIEGSQARLEYYPVKPGQVITNNNVASLISSGSYVGTDRVIEGFSDSAITGIIGIDSDGPGIEYISP
ncbi:TPA: hypothetical protein HA239_00605, partial [Candidatus Woesearchaeota archaeon]|nr:hypothetical protein [Candidatus Woesearchaeota archaeon]